VRHSTGGLSKAVCGMHVMPHAGRFFMLRHSTLACRDAFAPTPLPVMLDSQPQAMLGVSIPHDGDIRTQQALATSLSCMASELQSLLETGLQVCAYM
jgi:hypothetical protein